jgi:hypothetical protein
MPRRFFLLLYMMRVPLFHFAILGVGLPLAFRTSMLHGVADLTSRQLFSVSFLTFLLLSEAITCAFLVLVYGEERADGWQASNPTAPSVSTWQVVALYLGAVGCYISLFVALRRFMAQAVPGRPISMGHFVVMAGGGLAIGCVVLLIVFLLTLYVAKPEDDNAIEVFAFPIFLLLRKIGAIDRGIREAKRRPADPAKLGSYAAHTGVISGFVGRLLGPGYGTSPKEPNPVALHPGHRFATMLTVVLFAVYVYNGRSMFHLLTDPAPWPQGVFGVCVLAYLLQLSMFSCALLSGLTFFFDRFRLPALLMLALGLYVLSLRGSSDHTFQTVPLTASKPLPTPGEVLARMPGPVIVVAAAGGGIQSAAWTSQVLCGLREQVPGFSGHVAAISGVSGGAVGTMFYLRCLGDDTNASDAANGARESSLEAVAWGLTHPDLRRVFLSGLIPSWSRADRGWALEKALLKFADFPSEDRLLTGSTSRTKWPAILLNSTDAETGDPMVFTNTQFPAQTQGSSAGHALTGFHARFVGQDVMVETAARMSAAFPYVSPVARPDGSGADHFADGGYFDNSGIFALSEWLKAAASEQITQSRAPRPILFLQLDAFPDDLPEQDSSTPASAAAAPDGPGVAASPDGGNSQTPLKPKKWFYQIYAPIETMLNVRSEGQVVRDNASGADLLELLAARGHPTTWLRVSYNTEAKRQTKIACPAQPPLSWHLTFLEKTCIQRSWENIVHGAVQPSPIDEIRKFLQTAVPAPAAAAAAAALPRQIQKAVVPPAPIAVVPTPAQQRKPVYMQQRNPWPR